jgi:AraC family transcriptional regulator
MRHSRWVFLPTSDIVWLQPSDFVSLVLPELVDSLDWDHPVSKERIEHVTQPSQKRMILVGANEPLPKDHFWFDGKGFSVYAAKQPRSTWQEHVHDCVQVTVGLEPAHMHVEWRATGKLRQSKEFIGNAVSVIPARVPHKTLWQRRAALIHIYIGEEFLLRLASDVLQQDSLQLQTTYLVRDLLIEELARSLYMESEGGQLNASGAKPAVTTLCVRLLRAYSVRKGEAAYATGGLGPTRERRVREYIEADMERDLSIQSLADVVGLSPQHFAVLFRESTGFTPHQYVNHRRIACAQELLKKADVPLIEISMQCGFSSQSQFITTFRKLVGMTPGRFRSSLTASQS